MERVSDFRRCKRSSRLKHRMDVMMTQSTTESKKQSQETSGKLNPSCDTQEKRSPHTHGPECNPRSERAHVSRKCGGVSQIEQFSSFLPTDSGILFRTPFFTASLLFPSLSSSYNLSFRPHCFQGCLFTFLPSPYSLRWRHGRHTKHHRGRAAVDYGGC